MAGAYSEGRRVLALAVKAARKGRCNTALAFVSQARGHVNSLPSYGKRRLAVATKRVDKIVDSLCFVKRRRR